MLLVKCCLCRQKVVDTLYRTTSSLDVNELDPLTSQRAKQPALRHISLRLKPQEKYHRSQSVYCCQGGNMGIICSSFLGLKT